MRRSKPKLFSVALTNRLIAYILAKLKLTYEELEDSLGFPPLGNCHSIGPQERQVRTRCLLYFLASHGFDLEEMEWEAEQRLTSKDAAAALKVPTAKVEALIKEAGIPLLTEKPLSILRADLMLFAANPQQAPKLSRLLRSHPLTRWRRQEQVSHYRFIQMLGERSGAAHIAEWEAGLTLPANPKLIEKIGSVCGQGMYYAMLEWKRDWDAANKVSPYYVYRTELDPPSQAPSSSSPPQSETHSTALSESSEPQEPNL